MDLEGVAEAREGALTSGVAPPNVQLYTAPEVKIVSPTPADSTTSAAAAAAGEAGIKQQQSHQQEEVVEDRFQGQHLSRASFSLLSEIYSVGVICFDIFTDACGGDLNGKAVSSKGWMARGR